MKGKKIITVLLVVCLLSFVLSVSAFATVTESSGDGYSLYNGVKLPNINSVWTDKVAYPVCVISNPSNNVYYIWLGTSFGGVEDGGFYIYGGLQQYGINGDGQWVLVASKDGQQYIPLVFSPWVSADVINSSGNAVVTHSDPIPLDGYNLIEWDGDTNGLFYDNNSAILTYEYYPAYDAFSVMELSYAEYPVVISGFSTSTDDTASGWIVAPPTSDYAFSAASVVNGDVSYTMALKFDDIDDTGYTKMIAYRPVESPPDEGGGDDDDPQPPCGG